MLELARIADREAVEALAQSVQADLVTWRPDLYEPAEVLYTEARFQEAVKERRLYVAKVGQAVCGYVLMAFRTVDRPGMAKRKILVVEEFCVDEICRSQGIGSEMMAEVRALAKAFRCTDLQLEVYPQNDDAVGFCQKCGYTIRSIEMQRKV